MPKILIVMRHAKSGWDMPVPDKDRPLNARGRGAATQIGNWLRAQGITPDEILCSSATRTRETTERLGVTCDATYIDALYLASSDQIMAQLQKAAGESVLIVGHNPGIAEFAERLAQTAPAHPRFFDYPTAATTVFSCPVTDWSGIKFHSCTAENFVTPHDLP